LAAGAWWDPRSYTSVLTEMNPLNVNGSFTQTALSIGDAMGGALSGLTGNGWDDLTNAGNGFNGHKGLLEQTECDKAANYTVKGLLGVAAGAATIAGTAIAVEAATGWSLSFHRFFNANGFGMNFMRSGTYRGGIHFHEFRSKVTNQIVRQWHRNWGATKNQLKKHREIFSNKEL